MTKKIVFIGAGNVASHIAPALEESGAGVVIQVYSRTQRSAEALASRLLRADATDDLAELSEEADVYIISVADDAIAAVVESMKGGCRRDALWMHTSGSVGMEVLSPLTSNYGVFYPLQTFSKDVKLDVGKVPLFIEGSSAEVTGLIRRFASETFESIYEADSDTRRKMHIAAVFACNFTNYMWTLSSDLLSAEGLPFEVMRPLLEETIRKAFTVSPEVGQTGPAVRGDMRVIGSHLSMLEGDKHDIYRLLSDSIVSRYSHSG